MHERNIKPLVITALLAAAIVLAGSMAYLAQDLPDVMGDDLNFPATGFQFAFGSGHPAGDRMIVDAYADGHALLSSGPVKINAKRSNVLRYTWLPSQPGQEAIFFWRQQGVADDVVQIALPVAGTHYLNLSANTEWRDEITEFGFFLIGQSNAREDKGSAEIGPAALVSDRLGIRLQLLWQGWSVFEGWSQQSINFLRGGSDIQSISLPVLISAWLLLTMLLFWLASRRRASLQIQHLLQIFALLSLMAWMLLDIRWTSNNFRQLRLSLPNLWQADAQQRLVNNLDGGIYQYVEHLKNDVIKGENFRILIIAEQGVPEYYLQKAKYHLLPHSANAKREIDSTLVPESVDFVIFFGESDSIGHVQGWSSIWQQGLKRVDTNQLATMYEVRKL